MNYFFGVLIVLAAMAVFGLGPIVLGAIAFKHATGDAMKGTRRIALTAIFLGVFWFFVIPIAAIPMSSSKGTGLISSSIVTPVAAPARLSQTEALKIVTEHNNHLSEARRFLRQKDNDAARYYLTSARALRTTRNDLPDELSKSMLDQERELEEELRRPQPMSEVELPDQERETKATLEFETIQPFVKDLKPEAAVARLQDFVRRFPDTSAAARARDLLAMFQRESNPATTARPPIAAPTVGDAPIQTPSLQPPPQTAPQPKERKKYPPSSVGEQNPFE